MPMYCSMRPVGRLLSFFMFSLLPACLSLHAHAGSGTLDLDNLFNYANQPVPGYINKDNTTPGNPITDAGATLGRVLFYDKRLSSADSISCSSCTYPSRDDC